MIWLTVKKNGTYQAGPLFHLQGSGHKPQADRNKELKVSIPRWEFPTKETDGVLWQFLSLQENIVTIDRYLYHFDDGSKIMGILKFFVENSSTPCISASVSEE